MSTRQRIAKLTAQRSQVYTNASGRPLTAEEREMVKLLTAALSTAWELRRLELAQRPPIDHELIIVAEFSVGAVLVPAYEPLAQRAHRLRETAQYE